MGADRARRSDGDSVNPEIGRFLKDRRHRLQPSDVGLISVGRRRTKGLRREEVAALAGVGATWYTMLESGRAVNPSDDVLNAVARALRLTQTETEYLLSLPKTFELVDLATVPSEVLKILQATACPAYVVERGWHALAWNDAFTKLWKLDDVKPPLDVVRLMFFEKRARFHHGANLERNASAAISMIRYSRGLRPNARRFHEMSELFSTDERLAAAWNNYRVMNPLETASVAFDVPIGETMGYVVCNADLPLADLTIVYQITEVSESTG